MSGSCPKCGAQELRWSTRVIQVPVDVLQCHSCGHVLAQEDWWLPVLPLMQGHCLNCTSFRTDDHCNRCGLSGNEHIQVHDELRQMVSPQMTLLDAARHASRQGRRVMALKLATAAAGLNENNQGHKARALRVWLLSAIGESNAALQDAKAWVDSDPGAPAVAWASYGQQLQHSAFPGAAADAYARALKIEPRQHALRVQRAHMLFQLHRTGQAMEEVEKLIYETGLDNASEASLVQLVEQLCNLFEERYREDEVEHLITMTQRIVGSSPVLLAHRARLFATKGDTRSAKLDLRAARAINPELEIYERVEKLLKPQRGSWWRW